MIILLQKAERTSFCFWTRKEKSGTVYLFLKLILVLLIAAFISGFIGDITDTIVIVVIVLLNAILGFYQEYRADKAMQALKKMSVTQASVLRNNQMIILPATQLVPGDVVSLETGNAVPADIRLGMYWPSVLKAGPYLI